MTNNIETLTVALGVRSYPIHIGHNVLTDTQKILKPHISGGRVAILTDETVAKLHLQTLQKGLGDREVVTIILKPGENTKSFAVLQNVLDKLLQANFSREDTLIAFGGGVIGDLTGFVASVLKRGCQFIQIPTTLLAQVDSSVGGKTAINTPAGKNLVGSFYQPKCVLIDTNILSTLDPRQMRAGYAEVLKYALINDKDFFGWLEENASKLLRLDQAALRTAILSSCTAKANIVKRDEYEHGERALLNLGHSFAHALEAKAGYDGTLLHGEAVSAGLLMAFEYSQDLGCCSGQDVKRVRQHLSANGMPVLCDLATPVRNDPDALFAFMGRDKKNTGDDMKLILARGIGRAFVEPSVGHASILGYLKKVCSSKALAK